MKDNAHAAVVSTPVGKLGICISREGLARIEMLSHGFEDHGARNALAADVVGQLFRYFEDPRWRFELPLALRGTAFQMRVWRELLAMSAGELVTYGVLARRLGTAARAVGQACAVNPIPIIVPCHRVVGTAGLVGYKSRCDSEALAVKQWLIIHEQR